jgi:L-tryptophan--pyruvate aminotransferase
MIHQHNCYIVICTRWAIVKELAIAQKMAQFIELNTIGVSQDAQVRATGLIRAIMKGYNSNSQLIKSSGPLDAAPAADHLVQPAAVAAAKDSGHDEELLLLQDLIPERRFFHFGKAMMEARWKGVRAALAGNQSVTVQDPSTPAHCTFMGSTSTTNPGQNLPDPSHSSPDCGAGTESWT